MTKTNKVEILLARIEQKVDDLVIETKEIKQKATYTNGKIADAILQINTVQTKQSECPARTAFKQGKITANVWNVVFAFVAIVAAIAAWMK
jgi:hypothetical protein